MSATVRMPTTAAERARATPPAGRLGYVLKVFPRVSETFVINEIRALEDLGEDLRIFSLHHGHGSVPHRVLRELRSPVVYIEDELPEDVAVARARRRLARRLAVDPSLHDRLLPRKYIRLALALAAQAEAQGVGHLHAHFASRAGHVAALAASLSDRSYSLTAHAKDIYHRDVDAELLRWKIVRARFVATVTDFNWRHLRELVSAMPGVGDKIGRIYNGVDLDRFHPGPVPGGRPRLLGVGRLVEKKGFDTLIEACRLLRQRGFDFRCDIIGEGPEEQPLRAQLASAELDGIVTLGGVRSTEQVGEMLRAATVVVLPCRVARDGNIDALPTVLIEAMATGCPVVSTRISGIPEIVVDGETGLLVPPDDAAALADALGSLLEQPGRGEAMGRAGRQRAEQLFDLRANVAALRRLLRGDDGGASQPVKPEPSAR